MKYLKLINAKKWLVCLLLLTGHLSQAKNENLPMNREFYYLKITSVNCEVTCYLNGFPVYELSAEGEITNQVPVNLYLIGQENKLNIKIKPLNGYGKVEASYYLYREGEIVSSNDAQKEREIFVVESSDNVKEATFYFDNKRFNFGLALSGARIIRDEQVKEYATELLKVIKNKNVQRLLTEMQPKIRDYAIAFSVPEEMLAHSMDEQLTEMLSHKDLKKPAIADIITVPYCEGRLWELTIKPDLPFIYIHEESGATSLEIYVAMVDGQLKIVR